MPFDIDADYPRYVDGRPLQQHCATVLDAVGTRDHDKMKDLSQAKESAMKEQSNERSFKDPVCGMEVSRTTAIAEFVYQGKTFYFCAGACRQAFEAEPDKYIKHHRQHGMKPRQA